jgi:hypothetical protein
LVVCFLLNFRFGALGLVNCASSEQCDVLLALKLDTNYHQFPYGALSAIVVVARDALVKMSAVQRRACYPVATTAAARWRDYSWPARAVFAAVTFGACLPIVHAMPYNVTAGTPNSNLGFHAFGMLEVRLLSLPPHQLNVVVLPTGVQYWCNVAQACRLILQRTEQLLPVLRSPLLPTM